MLSTTLLAALSMLPQGPGSSTAPVVINEFSYDDSSTDTLEFVELYNRSGAAVDISNWSVDSEDPNGPNFTTPIPAGTTLPAGGFYVLGMAGVPNVAIALAGNLENSNESITLLDDNGRMIDTLVYEANKGVWNPALAEGEGIWGNATLIEGNDPLSWSRVIDGYDSDVNGDDFRHAPWSPGASNDLTEIARSVEGFDGLSVGSDAPDWVGSFMNPVVIDPTVADPTDPNNPNVIPASPQGGNAMIAWDSAGGGNASVHASRPSSSALIEAYVYIESALFTSGTGFYESWTLGFGSVPTFYNTPDPLGVFGFAANGNTGVAWTFQRTETSADLLLVDYNDGGFGAAALHGPTILGQISIQPGTNDGWQRIKLSVDGGQVEGRFGGTYGQNDGTVFTGTVSAGPRGLFAGYREAATPNTDSRALTLDAVRLFQCGDAASTNFGTALANSNGTTPTLAATSPAALGGTLTVAGSSFFPSAPVFCQIGLERSSPLTFGPLLPAGFAIWVDSFADLALSSDGSGTATFSQPLPAVLGLCGAELAFQMFQADTNMSAAIGAYHTDGLVVTVGQ